MVSPEYRRFEQSLRDSPKIIEMPLEEQRAAAERSEEQTAAPEGVTYEWVDAGGPRAVWVVPEETTADRVLLYFFGGGYVINSPHARWKFSGHLARASGCRVLMPDFRRGPEHPFPAAVEDATAAYRWLLGEGLHPKHLAVAGESSGGGLTMATLLAVREAGVPLPATAALMSPWLDLACTGESLKTCATVDLTCTVAGLRRMAGEYLNGQDPRHPLASPVYADLTGLPPLLVQAGGAEMLLDDSVRLARKAGVSGVDVTLEIWAEMQHVFQIAVGVYPEAGRAVAGVGQWLRRHLGIAAAV